jgi:cytochrome P450
MAETPPVDDWAIDYDIFDEDYIRDPTPVWDELRERCPIAHSDRWGGSYLPTRYHDIQALAKMVPELSSTDPLVVPPPEESQSMRLGDYGGSAPPISADPPIHTWTRRLLLPHFSPKVIEGHRQFTEQLCHRLIDGFIANGSADAAGDYAQQIPPAVIANKLGIDESRIEEFTFWVRNVLEFGLSQPELRVKYREVIRNFFWEQVADRQENPGDDLISALLTAETPDGDPIHLELHRFSSVASGNPPR